MTGYYGPAYHRPDLVAALDRAERYSREALVLSIVCPNDHRLARVLETEVGRLLTWDRNDLIAADGPDDPDPSEGVRTRPASRAVRWVALLDGPSPAAEASCRCRSGHIPGPAIDAALAAGRRRVIAEPTSVRGLFSVDGVSDGTVGDAR